MIIKLLTVALLAMTPWGEWAIAIPIGLVLKLPFFIVVIIAFAGNLIPVLIICLFWNNLKNKVKRFQGKRKNKAEGYLNRFGILGLIFFAPVSVGVYVSSITALLIGKSPQQTILLHIYSLILWGAVIVILYLLGLEAWELI